MKNYCIQMKYLHWEPAEIFSIISWLTCSSWILHDTNTATLNNNWNCQHLPTYFKEILSYYSFQMSAKNHDIRLGFEPLCNIKDSNTIIHNTKNLFPNSRKAKDFDLILEKITQLKKNTSCYIACTLISNKK